jgi:hypothetical protein
MGCELGFLRVPPVHYCLRVFVKAAPSSRSSKEPQRQVGRRFAASIYFSGMYS